MANKLKIGFSRLILFAGLCSTSLVAVAGPIGPASMRALAESADLIVVGNMSAEVPLGTKTISFALQIDRVLKGTELPASTVTVEWAPAIGFVAGPKQLVAWRGLWFLKKVETLRYNLLPVTLNDPSLERAFLPIPPGAIKPELVYLPTAPVVDKIAYELAATVEYQGILDGQLPKWQLPGMLESTKSPLLVSIYQRFAQSTLPRLKILGLAGLIRRGDVTALSRLELELESISTAKEFPELLGSISCCFRNPDPIAVGILGRLATSKASIPRLQSGPAYALRAMHTRETLPFLAQLLDSPEAELRQMAVGAMSAFAKNLPMETPENYASLAWLTPQGKGPFTTDETDEHFWMGPKFKDAIEEAKYITFWKSWWTRVQPLVQP